MSNHRNSGSKLISSHPDGTIIIEKYTHGDIFHGVDGDGEGGVVPRHLVVVGRAAECVRCERGARRVQCSRARPATGARGHHARHQNHHPAGYHADQQGDMVYEIKTICSLFK